MPFLTFGVGIMVYKYLDREFKILLIFVCFAALSEVLSIISWNGGNNTMPGAHIYVFLEFLILTLFYSFYLKEYIKIKYVWGLIGGFAVFCFFNALFFQKITVYPIYTRAVESIIIVLFSVLYFYKVMVEAKIKKLSKEPMIWVNTAMLVYFSINFFFHILLPVVVVSSNAFAKRMVYFFWTTNVFFHFTIAIAFYKQKRLAKK